MSGPGPDYQMFTRKGKADSVINFVRSLEPGVPVRVPEHYSLGSVERTGREVYGSGRVKLRTHEKEWWICLLKPEPTRVIAHAEVSYTCGHKVTVEVTKGSPFDIPTACPACDGPDAPSHPEGDE